MQFKQYDLSLKDDVEVFTKQLFYALFNDVCQEKANHLRELFLKICKGLEIPKANNVWEFYQQSFCEIRNQLDLDAKAFESTDPACKSLGEVYLAYPGFHAIAVYRLSHELYKIEIPVLPRMMSEYAHGVTGTDIHPGAIIGESFFIDHATGIVIGETTIIKNNVKIYQGVTLGGIQVKKELASTKRHPTIESNVTIYANATVLGGDVTIGKDSVIGANVCVIDSVPEGSIVTYESENKIIMRKSYVK
ncbi:MULTISPECIES: serine O-acetyltransferase EpsC [Tenacibaculum]|uniref:serine O-acetyltransferase EpsC n=1 Tax=Tenacibaculum TaxID=104267 RepID=UPI00089B0DB5|nr:MULTISPECIES: serine O-acetyltransferase EpsC [unclassified Tenacibaculum]RBW57157.1 serine acetyltransferase [Tenacibaculum sp. E3R01]SEE28566.1 serine O-acetyltransferase [Tenacibaculum sp. MAR_2010_89]